MKWTAGAVVLVLVACGGDDEGQTPSPATTSSTTSTAGAGGAGGSAPVGPFECPPELDDCRRIFVSSRTVTGDMSAQGGPDAICSTIAEEQNLGGTWASWTVLDNDGPRARLSRAQVPYVRRDGVVVAEDFSDLGDGELAAPILLDELGREASGTQGLVWPMAITGSPDDGRWDSTTPQPQPCDNWTTTEGSAAWGRADVTVGWSDYDEGAPGGPACAQEWHLYCLEQ